MMRLFDVISAMIGLAVLSPILGIIGLLIKLEDDGPVFYRGERVGRGGKMFKIYKFRTLVIDAERLGGSSTADDDPRITKIG